MDIPPIRYAKSGEAYLAYRVLGSGPIDLVFGAGLWSNLELDWEIPPLVQAMERLATFARVICFDRRGTGLSSRSRFADSVDQRADDLRAVMDAVGSERAAVVGYSTGSPFSIVFAATFPDRVSALIVLDGLAGVNPAWGGAAGFSNLDEFTAALDREWGGPFLVEKIAPTLARSERGRAAFARYLRLSMSPDEAKAQIRAAFEIDVHDVLPSIRVPTLVLHRKDDHTYSVEYGRELARAIPGARYVELPGDSAAWWFGDVDSIIDEIEEFLTGIRPLPRSDRVLATILFTDLVGSTERAAQLGDRRWREVLEAHHREIGRTVAQFRGREIKTTGDGVLATFDGPARAVQCATAIRAAAARHDLQVRAGLHTGEIELIGTDVGGIAVHLSARVAALAGPSEVLVSSTVKDLVVGSGIDFEDRGEHSLKGVPGEWRLYSVRSPD